MYGGALMILVMLGLSSCAAVRPTDITCGGTTRFSGLSTISPKGVYIGEIHGTKESPELAWSAICFGIGSGRHVILGLEYPRDQQSDLTKFFDTEDRTLATKTLLSTRFWSTTIDGRTSEAMLELLERVYTLRKNVTALAYDVPREFVTRKVIAIGDRDKDSAEFLEHYRGRSRKQAMWVLLGGNVHARKAIGVPNLGPDYEHYMPLGYLIRDWGLSHLNVEFGGGTAWACAPAPVGCGAQTLPERTDALSGPVFTVGYGTSSVYFDGTYVVPRLTASPPASKKQN
jgi:hypothetical protein